MKILGLMLTSAFVTLTATAQHQPKYSQTYTDRNNYFISSPVSGDGIKSYTSINVDISTSKSYRRQKMIGFGACFNELGWTSLNKLKQSDIDAIMKELFAKGAGANFKYCRMPVGANDFSCDWYSYNETSGDFAMKNFSISNDLKTLIPFIHKAQSFCPELVLWASPWCPPSWMKHNKHYASQSTGDEIDVKYRNGLAKDKIGFEGTDMFIQEPAYLEAYALYFKKFIDAYRKQGINIKAVMPQNEFNSAQIFPSCCWTAKGLANFVGKYLGPTMKKEKVDVLFGTMERANHLLVDTILNDKQAGKYVKGVGFQWAGKGAISNINKNYPNLLLIQTEQECGDGKNDWSGFQHSWDLLKHYIDNGVSIYDYWNISLLKGGISRWGWAQNSLVVVDASNATYEYTYEYYLMKHISHFVKEGAVNLKVNSSDNQVLAFMNPNKEIVLLYMEREGKDKKINLTINGKNMTLFSKANAMNTFCIAAH